MRYLILIPIVLLLSSCTKEVQITSSFDHQSQLFIEGILYPGEIAKIYVVNSTSFFSEKVTPQEVFARDVDLTLSTNNWSEHLVQDSTFDSFRCRWQPFYSGSEIIEHGETYHLTVMQKEQIFEASTTIDQLKVDITNVVYTPEFFDVYGGHDGVVVSFQDKADVSNFYRFQMDRWMDKTRLHAHVLDVLISDCTEVGELFKTVDIGRSIFNDVGNDGGELILNMEVSFEYLKGDTATVYLQSLDPKSAAFYKDLDDQLQSILNPFVEQSFIHSAIEGTLGVFGSAVRSDPVIFIYPQDNP